jgi:A118 family predicted phage portal protein
MAKTCCEDMASLIGVEKLKFTFDDKAAEDYVGKVLENNNFKVNATQLVELMEALGSCAFVVSKQDEKIVIDYIHGDLIFPLSWDNGEITECAFAIVGGDNEKTSYQLITHTLDENKNYVVEIVNLDANGEVARPSQIANELKGQDLEEKTTRWETNSPVPRFRFCKTNIVNNYDKTSPLGMSMFGNAIDILKGLDETYDSLVNEFDLGKKRIFIKSNLKAIKFPDSASYKDSFYSQVDVNDVMFYQIDWTGANEDKPPIYESNMTLRVAEHQQGLDTLCKLFSRKVGLGDGFYSFTGDSVGRTATEIISINSSLFRNLKKQELALQDTFIGLCRTIMDIANRELGQVFDVNQDITIDFDDSIIEDTSKNREQAMAEYNAGLIDHVEYFAITRKMTREQAQKFVAEMQATDTLKQVDSIMNGFDLGGGI